jgi:hypothetical protein
MPPKLIHEHPLAKDGQGRLKCRIGTVFPDQNAIVTLPGIHATQRMAYLDLLDQQRQQAGQPVLTRVERNGYWENAVDLIMEGNIIQIRPDPQRMPLAFAADEVLQQLPISKRQIRFLNVLNKQVREAIKRRGECWRITRLPSSIVEMEYMILGSKIAVGGLEMYYYNRTTGTRYLTCQEFCGLDRLDDWQLRKHLLEIQDLSSRLNSIGNLEVDFFQAEPSFRAEFQAHDFREVPAGELRQQYRSLRHRFREAVTAPFPHRQHGAARVAVPDVRFPDARQRPAGQRRRAAGAEFRVLHADSMASRRSDRRKRVDLRSDPGRDPRIEPAGAGCQ